MVTFPQYNTRLARKRDYDAETYVTLFRLVKYLLTDMTPHLVNTYYAMHKTTSQTQVVVF
jgi:hypothetical protein